MATIPQTRPITADEFLEMEFDGPAELVRGEIIEMTRPGLQHGIVCGNAYALIRPWFKQDGGWFVVTNDAGILTERNPDTLRGPDVFAIRKSHFPEGKPPVGWTKVPPELAIEVLSEHDRWQDVLSKSTEYLNAGVREVWVIDPFARVVHVFLPDIAPVQWSRDDQLTSRLLPGFSASVAHLFEDL